MIGFEVKVPEYRDPSAFYLVFFGPEIDLLARTDVDRAHLLFQIALPFLQRAADSVFGPQMVNGFAKDVDVSFIYWRKGSIEILAGLTVGGAALFKFFSDYDKFRAGFGLFIDDVRHYTPMIRDAVYRALPPPRRLNLADRLLNALWRRLRRWEA